MEERDIRFLAQVYSLVAKMQSVKVAVDGMKAANIDRASRGFEDPLYYEESFSDAAAELEQISNALAGI